MSPPLELQFVTSADRVERLPESPAEVAVVGRSNVGKSSLINALAKRDGLANTSKTPGRTQLLNCFAQPDGTTLVGFDLGFAKFAELDAPVTVSAVPERERDGIQSFRIGFLQSGEEVASGTVETTAVPASHRSAR